jgi:hypothetical protein
MKVLLKESVESAISLKTFQAKLLRTSARSKESAFDDNAAALLLPLNPP